MNTTPILITRKDETPNPDYPYPAEIELWPNNVGLKVPHTALPSLEVSEAQLRELLAQLWQRKQRAAMKFAQDIEYLEGLIDWVVRQEGA